MFYNNWFDILYGVWYSISTMNNTIINDDTDNIEGIDASCPICDSPEYFLLGILGKVTWCRCRACGMDFSVVNENNEEVVLTYYK